MYKNMSQCKEKIEQTCNVSLTDKETSDVSKCFSVMEAFKTGAEKCEQNLTNCSCWSDLVLTIQGVVDCKLTGNGNQKV